MTGYPLSRVCTRATHTDARFGNEGLPQTVSKLARESARAGIPYLRASNSLCFVTLMGIIFPA